VPSLRQAIVEHQQRFYDLTPEDVQVTMGATEAIAAAILGLVEPDQEVLAFDPTYDSYGAAAKMTGARLVPVPLHPPDWRFDPDELRAAITPKTRAFLINSPHNPTGRVLSREELQTIADVVIEHDLLAITDEVYEHLVFDGLEHIPLATLPGMAERTLTISSAGKTFSFTGWKVGWACGPAALVSAVLRVKQFLTFVNAGPLQPAVALALGLPDAYYTGLRDSHQGKRDRLARGLADAGFGVMRTAGTYFIAADITPLGESDGLALCRALPERCGVVAVPMQVFYDHPDAGRRLVRFAFCKRDDVLDQAVDRLRKLAA